MWIDDEPRAELFEEMAAEYDRIIWLNEVSIARTTDLEWKAMLIANNLSLRLEAAQARQLASRAREVGRN